MMTFKLLWINVAAFDQNYWLDAIIQLALAFIPSIGTAVLVAFLLDKAFKRSKKIGDSLVKSGIENIDYVSGKMSSKDCSILFGLNKREKPFELNLCFLTGDNFFLDNYNYLLELLNHGTKIKVLIAGADDSIRYKRYIKKYPNIFDRNTGFCDDDDKKELIDIYMKYHDYKSDDLAQLHYVERTYLMVSKEVVEKRARTDYNSSYAFLSDENRSNVWGHRIARTGDHMMQIALVTKIIHTLNKQSTNEKISLAYYKDEYRIPIILAKYKEKESEAYLLWTNMNAPVKQTTESVNVFGKTKEKTDGSYISDVMKSFDYLFDKYHK